MYRFFKTSPGCVGFIPCFNMIISFNVSDSRGNRLNKLTEEFIQTGIYCLQRNITGLQFFTSKVEMEF
jgi:hypothetical protein